MTTWALRDLFPDTVPVDIQGNPEVPITHLAYDSRCVQPGTLFFALPGTKTDGAEFLDHALSRGACAVVTSSGTPVPRPATLVVTPEPRRLLGLVADRFYGRPSEALTMIGITGTSGKTSTTYLLEAIGREVGWSVGVIGTINYRYRNREWPAPLTTPEAVELQALLRTMRADGVSHVVMEVSSHALAQDRVRGCHWDGAVFTNLGRDHLDFHTDLDEYFASKSRLFFNGLVESKKPGRFAVINTDDRWGAKLLTQRPPGRLVSYGLQDAMVSVRNFDAGFDGLRGILTFADGGEVGFSSPLLGEPHLYNILAAASVAYALGVPPARIAAGIARCPSVPGRLEIVPTTQPFEVLVDYAHKPDALERTLRSLRPVTRQRLVTVFGCGGDRDVGKRPLMGEIAGRLSDVVILTSDNPRTEDPLRILQHAEEGLIRVGMPRVTDPQLIVTLQRGYLVIADRREAIRGALAGAQPGDVVVIAGKGHENYQIIGSTKYPFDDRQEVRAFLGLLAGETEAEACTSR